MANVHVDYAQLQTSATQLRTGKEEMYSRLTQLQGQISQLVSSGFVTDRASGRFHESYSQWTNGAKQMLEGLTGMSAFLDTAIRSHQGLDDSLAGAAG